MIDLARIVADHLPAENEQRAAYLNRIAVTAAWEQADATGDHNPGHIVSAAMHLREQVTPIAGAAFDEFVPVAGKAAFSEDMERLERGGQQ